VEAIPRDPPTPRAAHQWPTVPGLVQSNVFIAPLSDRAPFRGWRTSGWHTHRAPRHASHLRYRRPVAKSEEARATPATAGATWSECRARPQGSRATRSLGGPQCLLNVRGSACNITAARVPMASEGAGTVPPFVNLSRGSESNRGLTATSWLFPDANEKNTDAAQRDEGGTGPPAHRAARGPPTGRALAHPGGVPGTHACGSARGNRQAPRTSVDGLSANHERPPILTGGRAPSHARPQLRVSMSESETSRWVTKRAWLDPARLPRTPNSDTSWSRKEDGPPASSLRRRRYWSPRSSGRAPMQRTSEGLLPACEHERGTSVSLST